MRESTACVFTFLFVLAMSATADPLLTFSTQEGAAGSVPDVHIYVLDVGSGGIPVDVTPPDAGGWGTVWSPDGRRLLFSSAPDDDPNLITDLYTMNSDGSDLQRITNTPDQIEEDAVWSPDGRKIAYFVGNPNKSRSLWVLDLNTNVERELVPIGGELLIKYARPAWSPDGQQIAFDAFGPANLRGIYVVHVDSKQVDLLHRDLWATLVQHWLPGGEILVTSGERQRLSILRPGEGTEVLFPEVQEQFSYAANARAAWRWPDLFVFSTNMGIFSIERDGTGLRQLVPAERSGFVPDLWTDSLDVLPVGKLTTTWGEVKADRVTGNQ